METPTPTEPNGNKPDSSKPPGLLSMLTSVAAAIFGVQSDKNREKDFKKGDATQFIALGISAVLILLMIMMGVVNHVLSTAAS